MASVINIMDYGHDGYRVVLVAILMIVMQILMLTGRLVSRRLQKVMLGADDYVLVSATVRSEACEQRTRLTSM